MSNLAIVPICEHIKNDGIRCGTPALRGRHFCYHHDRVHRGHQIAAKHSCRVIPPLRNARNIRVAALNIIRDLRDGRIDLPTARVMAYALQVANTTLKLSAEIPDLHQELKNTGTYA